MTSQNITLEQAKAKGLTSLDIAAEKRAQLKALLPEAFAGEALDLDQLRRALGDFVEAGKERYGLNWPGKAECMKVIQAPSIATLRPCREESVNFDTTENLFIEGDNLEVLKLLQKAYFGKVKMIYIEPPYNTGKEFIYPDKYSETLETYLAYTGQIDDEGRRFATDTDAGGRRHARWLNMMYPRLYLARNLLREDGVIFISIDDNEQANLKALCDLVFGEENFVNNIIWQKKYSPSNDAKWLSDNHDFIICYAKNKEIWRPNLLERNEDALARYRNPDNDSRGDWKCSDLSVKSYSAHTDYAITTPSGRVVNPPAGSCWRVSKEKFEEMVKDNRIWFGNDGSNVPAIKRFLSEVKDGVTPLTLWTYEEVGHNQTAKQELKDLFKDSNLAIFDTPKPVKLLSRILDIGATPDALVMDFFAGSGSLAHAVMHKNFLDGGTRHCISVQLPEKIEDGKHTVASISKERIRRAAKKIAEEQNGKLNLDGTRPLDLGFKVFKLAPSNFRIWDGEKALAGDSDTQQTDTLLRMLEEHVDHINTSSTPEDILYELLLKAGFSLTLPIEKRVMAGKDVYAIEDGAMLICLDKHLTDAVIDAMAATHPIQVICLDEGFQGNDQLKANAVQTFKSRALHQESEIVFRTV
jgi:adenine-specific DNA-methyltransferase